MKNTKLELFDSIETLTLYRWDRYNSTKDNNWFLINYDGRQAKIIDEELIKIENKIVDEYFKAIDDNTFSNKLQKWAQIDKLRNKYYNVNRLLERFAIGFDDMEMRLLYILELKKWGFVIPELNNRISDIEKVIELKKALEGLNTQIAILLSEVKEDGRKETQSLNRQLQIATVGLQYPYRLDAKILTVSEWIEIQKLLEEKSKLN